MAALPDTFYVWALRRDEELLDVAHPPEEEEEALPNVAYLARKTTPRSSPPSSVISADELVEQATSGSALSQNLYQRLEQERQRLKERRAQFLS